MTSSTTESPPAVPTATGWDTELFVLWGDNRSHLQARVASLAAYVEGQPGIRLPELAASLAAELAPGGARLAVVAGTSADLLAKLRRAADRLADAKFRQVRDTNGIYFFEQPLGEQGTVALLFPGEGAQYLNMLADLCGVFPEVEEVFAWCDQLAAEVGQPALSLRRTLHLPADATAEDRAAAEAELRKLGPSIFGVLLADLAMTRLLGSLQVPVSAVAGHSAGELAALLAAGALPSEEVVSVSLVDTMAEMDRQEDSATGPEAALLAVGAGKPTVMEAAAAIGVGSVFVAMDNCPHQSVAVGPAVDVSKLETALADRGIICERLPFNRPYHTPLFEPYMDAFRAMFGRIPFGPPHTPIYCCSTGERFPDDPNAIRELTVNHWIHPVEFTRLIETMHADGVRLFVEAGPRGNLSAFVEDILRGKPFAAIPANVPRKSGPTQINHMVAQLVAHHVPVNLAHLYAHRNDASHPSPAAPFPDQPAVSIAGGLDAADPVMHGYFAAMEQFLDVQQQVMEAFLAGDNLTHARPPLAAGEVLPEIAASEPALPPFGLVEQITHHDPGREIIFRRIMDEREDLHADDHTLGGRGVSRVDPRQNGLPVLPMTFSLEAMAEAASLLAPGKVVIALRAIRLYRWLPFDPEPTTLEVRATVSVVDPETGTVEVKANVRDLGNSFLRDGANKVACEAVVILADRYPDPPEPLPFTLTDEQPCRSGVEDLRRNMFHGPLFHMIRTLGRVGKEGIEGTAEVQPRDRWFRSNPDPRVVIDPVLVDASMHLLGAWHLEQPDWAGRILLPIGVNAVEFFSPIPAVGSPLLVRGHNEEETARQARHGLEVFGPDGRIWLRLTGASYWRFYLPFGHVNFFGPKDEYFLSRDWPEAAGRSGDFAERNAERKAGAESADYFAHRLPHPAFPRCHALDPPADLKQPVLRASGVRVTMTPREQAEFRAWTGTDAELNDWFFGRMLAKDAVRAAWGEKHGESIFPADLETEAGPDGRLTVRPRGETKAEPLPPVAVAIANGTVAAFSAFAERVGLALVPMPKNSSPADEQTAREQAACRAAADALRIDPAAVTLISLEADTGAAVVSANGQRFRVRTARHKNVVAATTLCEAADA